MSELLVKFAFLALEALPGPTPAHAPEIAQATASASLEATCTGDWSESDFCQPVWTLPPERLVVTLIGVGHFESGFLPRIQAGQCRKWECDAAYDLLGKFLYFKARSYWQLQKTSFARAGWEQMIGVELFPTFEAARAASRVLGAGVRACGSVEGAISWYGAQHCQWRPASRRYALVRRLEQSLSGSR